jgi:hypothetical protein
VEQPDYLRLIKARGVGRGGRVNDLFVSEFPVTLSDEPPHNERTAGTLSALCACTGGHRRNGRKNEV